MLHTASIFLPPQKTSNRLKGQRKINRLSTIFWKQITTQDSDSHSRSPEKRLNVGNRWKRGAGAEPLHFSFPPHGMALLPVYTQVITLTSCGKCRQCHCGTLTITCLQILPLPICSEVATPPAMDVPLLTLLYFASQPSPLWDSVHADLFTGSLFASCVRMHASGVERYQSCQFPSSHSMAWETISVPHMLLNECTFPTPQRPWKIQCFTQVLSHILSSHGQIRLDNWAMNQEPPSLIVPTPSAGSQHWREGGAPGLDVPWNPGL